MFVLKPKPTFMAQVTIPTPAGEKGIFTVEFKHKGRKELKKFFDDAEATTTDFEKIAGIVAGWSGVDTPFSKEALEQLLDAYPAAARELYNAYYKALFDGVVGEIDAQSEKN